MPSLVTEIATLGGGCFWCLEACYENIRGVSSVVSGYSGGEQPKPTYRAVCNGDTGHIEVVQVTFDPEAITYAELLDLFFTMHDPTTRDRQGADVGTQYRSVIFTHSTEQQEIAESTIARWNAEKIWPVPIVTQVLPAPTFYPAEEYHQGYFRTNPDQPYCQAVVQPKAAKIRAKFAARWKS